MITGIDHLVLTVRDIERAVAFYTRVLDMIAQHDEEGFGTCTNHGACQEACPKGISVDFIARLNRDLMVGTWKAAGD